MAYVTRSHHLLHFPGRSLDVTCGFPHTSKGAVLHTPDLPSPCQAMSKRATLDLVPVEELQLINGVPFPAFLKFRQLLVTGPPGCGKTRLINKVGGWPEEGYIDLTFKNWWRAQSLTFRPREVHLGFPFVGHDEALTVFDKEWLEAPTPPELDVSRIILPPAKTHFLSVNWRKRFVFEFLIPPAESILKWRIDRSHREVHPVDEGVTLEQVENQVGVYREAALYFHRSGMFTYVRDEYGGNPKQIADEGQYTSTKVEVGYSEN